MFICNRFPIILDLINKLYSKNDKDCLIAKNIIELLMLETSLTVSDILLNFQENLELNESQNFRRLGFFRCSFFFFKYFNEKVHSF